MIKKEMIKTISLVSKHIGSSFVTIYQKDNILRSLQKDALASKFRKHMLPSLKMPQYLFSLLTGFAVFKVLNRPLLFRIKASTGNHPLLKEASKSLFDLDVVAGQEF